MTEVELVSSLKKLRRRNSMVPTDRWLVTAGGIMVPIGAALLVAGWYGAAHTTRLWEEIPYLISGGLFGLAFVIVGVALYFGYWLTRVVSGNRQTLEVLLRIEERLGGAPVAGVSQLVATRTGTMYHRADCQIVAGRPADELRSISLPAPGMTACKICMPET